MPDLNPLDAPLNVATVDGEVVATHPSGPAAVALTPGAALVTGQLLVEAARTILDQACPVQSSQVGAGEE
jgi:hypothetical protein